MRDADHIEVSGPRRLRVVAVVVVAGLVVGGIALAANLPRGHAPGKTTVRVLAPPTPEPTPPRVVQFLTASLGFVEVATLGYEPHRVYRTTDGGATWSVVFEGPSVRYQFLDADHGFVIFTGRPGPLKTADAGRTWAGMAGWPLSGTPAAIRFETTEEGLAYFANGTSGDLYRTTDGGGSWVPVLSRAPLTSVVGLGLAGGLAWLLGRTGAGTELYVSRDAGLTWSPVALPRAPGAGLAATEWRVAPMSGTLGLTTQWASAHPVGEIPTYLYLLGSGNLWSPLALPEQPLDEYALALDDSGNGLFMGEGQTCLMAGSRPGRCFAAGVGNAGPVLGLEILADGSYLLHESPPGADILSVDGGGHWHPLPMPPGSG